MPNDCDCPQLIANIMAKCQQYWNERNIPDAEVHTALERIHEWALQLAQCGCQCPDEHDGIDEGFGFDMHEGWK